MTYSKRFEIQILSHLKDPNVQAQIRRLSKENSTILLDEFGKEFAIVHIGMMNVPSSLLEKQDVADLIREPWKAKIRDEDIFLFTHTRTGTTIN